MTKEDSNRKKTYTNFKYKAYYPEPKNSDFKYYYPERKYDKPKEEKSVLHKEKKHKSKFRRIQEGESLIKINND
jgi:hypothetical protein